MMAQKRTPAADAYRTHATYWADSGGDIVLPVDPYALAHSMGIEVYRAVLGPHRSGYLTVANGKAAIYVNESFSASRNRFTVAHEIGHYVDLKTRDMLGQGGTFDRDRLASQGTDPEEIYANRFAAALLMPRTAVETLHKSGLKAPELATRFRVSKPAMENRISNLGLT